MKILELEKSMYKRHVWLLGPYLLSILYWLDQTKYSSLYNGLGVHHSQNKIFFSLLLDGTSNVKELLYPDYIVPLIITINGPELTRIGKSSLYYNWLLIQMDDVISITAQWIKFLVEIDRGINETPINAMQKTFGMFLSPFRDLSHTFVPYPFLVLHS